VCFFLLKERTGEEQREIKKFGSSASLCLSLSLLVFCCCGVCVHLSSSGVCQKGEHTSEVQLLAEQNVHTVS